ncbi:hypothetical protein [uncultured Bdellovibrio sp.]|uniref:hypothetical protein n=1 Tax=Bdellovibrio sp. HCB-162 TaxID=3394234 RepID=UPI0025CED940|nr:hypothetical protein [uncultured Bdellovibrio sp.]
MKKLLYVSLLVLSVVLGSCSQEAGNVEVSISGSSLPLIPATAVSCLARENAGTDTPTADISPSYFRVPTITFTRKDTTKNLIIAFIRINIPVPGSSTPINCEVGGDGLAALKGTWFNSGTKEALIPSGDANKTFSTDCALYCGGITMNSGTTASGTMEVFGLERDAAGNETPVKTSTTITVESF